MTKKNDKASREQRQSSTIIAVGSIIGLTACFIFATWEEQDVPFFLYVIFGGGILGDDSILRIIKSVFRLDR